MSVQKPIRPSIAFFGPTGGCANACLVHTLRAGHSVVALARKPSKLKVQLLEQGLGEETLSRQLIITQGDATDVSAVKRTIMAGGEGQLVSTIVSGLGAAPSMQFSLNPANVLVMDQPEICATATQALFTALQEIYAENPALTATKPLATFISTTGISDGPEDVPSFLHFLYHWMLVTPHKDKKNLENLYRNNMAESDEDKRLFQNVIGIRPTLLFGAVSVDDAIGLHKIKSGTEKSPAIGYSIKRADVGNWMFVNVIQKRGRGFEGEMVSLTQ